MRKAAKKVVRPWGGYEIIEKKNNHWVKKLFVTEAEQTSLQSHNHRKVLKGKVRATCGNKTSDLSVGDSFHVGQGERHRLYGVTNAVVPLVNRLKLILFAMMTITAG